MAVPALLRLSPTLLNAAALRALSASARTSAGGSTMSANAPAVDLFCPRVMHCASLRRLSITDTPGTRCFGRPKFWSSHHLADRRRFKQQLWPQCCRCSPSDLASACCDCQQ